MANQLLTFMLEDDERSFVLFLERYHLQVYPRRVPPDWKTFEAKLSTMPQFPEEELYLLAADIGPAEVDPIKRGPDKGLWRVDEVRSPVIFWERSKKNEEGELLNGQLWAEIDITQQTGRRDAAPDRFRAKWIELELWIHKTWRRGQPKEYWVGPSAARAVKEQKLVLRQNEHRGETVSVHR